MLAVFLRKSGVLCGVAIFCVLGGLQPSYAEITFDGTMGPQGNLSGQMVIPENMGTRAGRNLFHSFGVFNINPGESATFTSNFSGWRRPGNVIGRVTGGSRSLIDGLLSSDIAGADVWLINPSGLLFGENGQVDVPAGFHASTGDYVGFEDAGRFPADPALDPPVLSVAPPVAFGFLGPARAGIDIQNATLTIGTGETISLVGGDVAMTGGTVSANGGRILIVSTDSAGEAVVDGSKLTLNGFSSLSDVSINSKSRISAGGQSGGRILIRGGQFELDDSSVEAIVSTEGIGTGAIDIVTSGETLLKNNALLHAGTTSRFEGSSIHIESSDLKIRSDSAILSDTTSAGNAGDLFLSAKQNLSAAGGGRIMSRTSASGSGGSMNLTAGGKIKIKGSGSQIASITAVTSANERGAGGNITLRADQIEITDDGTVLSNTEGDGNAGHVSITADTAVTIAERGRIVVSTIGESAPDNPGGGRAGDLSIEVKNGDLTIEGNADTGIFADSSGESANASGGDGGNVSIVVGNDFTMNGGYVGTRTFGVNDGGDVSIEAVGAINLDADSNSGEAARIAVGSLRTVVQQEDGNGQGGDSGSLEIMASTVNLGGKSILESTTKGAGNGGDIIVEAGNLTVDGGRINASNQLPIPKESSQSVPGTGGDVFLRVSDTLTVRKNESVSGANGLIKAVSNADGAGGNITIEAGRIEISDDGSISTLAKSDGNGGSINIVATDLVKLSRGGEIAALATGDRATEPNVAGSTGDISIGADRVTVNNGAIIVETRSGGDAGNISIVSSGKINVKNRGRISIASTGEGTINGGTAGNAGNIYIEGDQIAITGSDNENNDDETRTGISIITEGEGNAGSITLKAWGQAILAADESSKLLEAPLVVSRSVVKVATLGTQKSAGSIAGNAGDIDISADAVIVQNDGKIVSETDHDGNAGSVRITVEQGLSVENGGRVEANSRGRQAKIEDDDGKLPEPYDPGRSGNVEVIVNNGSLSIDGNSNTGLFVASGGNGLRGYGGNVGDINVSVSDDVVIDGGFITQRTYGQSRTGDISVAANGNVTTTGKGGMKVSSLKTPTDQASVSGKGGDAGTLSISADIVALQGNSILESKTNGSGNGGLIEINARRLKIHGGRINTSSQLADGETKVIGNAGDIKLNVQGTLSVRNDSDTGDVGIVKSSANEEGDAGSIDIKANRIVLSQGAIINSSTEGDGDAGIISLTATEDVTIKGTSRVTTTTTGKRATRDGSDGMGGRIVIAAQNVAISDEGRVVSNTNGDGDAGNIDITVVDEIRLEDSANISVDTIGTKASSDALAGRGGDLTITVTDGNMFISGQATISADSGEEKEKGLKGPSCDCFGGKGGNIRIDVLRGANEDGGNIHMDKGEISASVYGQNDGGGINIHADGSIIMDNNAKIGVSARKTVVHQMEDGKGSGGDAGSITIDAQELTLQKLSILESRTFGSGAGGKITVNAGSLNVDGGRINASGALPINGVEGQSVPGKGGDIELNIDGKLTVNQDPSLVKEDGTPRVNGVLKAVANAANGDGGQITINAGSLEVRDGGGIQVRALGAGDAGTISIVVEDSIVVTSNGTINAATTGVRDLEPNTAGRGGDITIEAASLEVSKDSNISASTSSDGDAGRVSITLSDGLFVSEGGKILVGTQGTRATSKQSAGRGGDLIIKIKSGDLLIDGEQDIPGEIETGLFASSGIEDTPGEIIEGGPGGSITLDVGGDVLMNGGVIEARTLGKANGGSIGIDTSGLQMMNGAVITAASTGAGDAGSVRIDTIGSISLQQSAIQTSSSEAEGGDIDISANESIFLDGSSITAEANGDGGNLTIGDAPAEDRVVGGIPEFVVLRESTLRANANEGDGGRILITTNAFVADINSIIDASSTRGLDGEVRIESPNNIAGTVVQLETPDFDISDLLASTCAPRDLEDTSSFAVRTSVVPPLPDDYRSSPLQWLASAPPEQTIEVEMHRLASASEIPCSF